MDRAEGASGAARGRRAKTVLVVDDDPDVREVVALALELEGYAVARAVDGIDALLALRSEPLPAAIVLDVEMATMGGSEFREEQARDPALAAIPVLVLSSSSRGIDARYRLAKPADPDTLVRAVRELAGPP